MLKPATLRWHFLQAYIKLHGVGSWPTVLRKVEAQTHPPFASSSQVDGVIAAKAVFSSDPNKANEHKMVLTRDKGYPVGPGALLIINEGTFTHPDLKCREPGTSEDRDSLELVFRSLGYGVHIANNCNGDAFKEHLASAVDLIGDGVGPFVLAFLSHGCSGDRLYFADGTQMSMLEIRRALLQHRTLDGRPKIIIVQACRGQDHRSMFIILTCDEILKSMSGAERATSISAETHIIDLSMSVNKSMENYVTRCHGFRMLTSPETISSLKKPLFLGPPVDEDKFGRAKERIDGLKLELARIWPRAAGQVQVVPNLQPDDVHKDPGCHCVDDCVPSGTCRCRQAGAPCGPECRHDGGPKNKSDKCANAPRACRCKGGCGSGRCGCRKYSVPCGERCHPGAACGNRQAPREFSSTVKVKFERAQSSKDAKEKSTSTTSTTHSPDHVDRGTRAYVTDGGGAAVSGCKCRTGCGAKSKLCGCRKRDLICGPRCHGGSPCENLPKKGPKQKSNKLATGNVNVSDTACPTGGEGSRCGLGAADRAVCAVRSATAGRAGSNCANRIKASGADKIVKCKCKTGCSPNSRCSCRKADVLCGPNCHPGEQCEN
ncbi:uncharacterized protein LOC113216768 isoform X2 [Frankliniella occidentalis]|uniref:Uncharacterized protein LOC113216768 isoform X2 n=1 Tax=Frankliniella occidentalis TaxID=133901 RepID=A0A9C6X241_FRAOC|nr:uncharacterized protein LOC113216768 isoform X2 [Frankliniella occidentalis]